MKNIVVICCDSLRADALNQDDTPELLRIAGEGVYYRDAYSLGSVTPTSMPYLLCGEEKFTVGNSVQHKVKKYGYRSKMVTTNFDPVYDSFRYGFDEAVYKPDIGGMLGNKGKRRVGWFIDKHFPFRLRRLMHRLYTRIYGKPLGYTPADRLFQVAYEVLEPSTFLWVHLMDPHIPYIPSAEKQYVKDFIEKANTELLNAVWLRGDLEPVELELVKTLYALNVKEMDKAIGTFYDKVKENSVFIVCADHGDEHGEYGGYGHKFDRVNPALRHVPFIVCNEVKDVVDEKTGLDILPHLVLKIAEQQ